MTSCPPTLTHCILIHKEGGGEVTREKVRGAIINKVGRKIPTRLTVYLVYKLYLTPVKTTFRVWCLFTELVHVPHRKTLDEINLS
jgi:hypothetical protein